MFISSIVVQRYVHIKNSSDNFPKPFMIREMYGCQWMILMGINNIVVSMTTYSTVDNLISTSTLREKTQVLQRNNLRIKSLSCFKH